METRYYDLDPSRARAAGGSELILFSRPHAQSVSEGGGQLLDFERARLRLERKALLKHLMEPEMLLEEPEEEDPVQAEQVAPSTPPSRGKKLFLGLDLLASGAVLAVCAVIIKAFAAVL